jgi:hypothetical protein
MDIVIEKLNYLKETKAEILNAMHDKGIYMLDEETFDKFPEGITEMVEYQEPYPIARGLTLWFDAHYNTSATGGSNTATTWKPLIAPANNTTATKVGTCAFVQDPDLVIDGQAIRCLQTTSGGFYHAHNLGDGGPCTMEIVFKINAYPSASAILFGVIEQGGTSIYYDKYSIYANTWDANYVANKISGEGFLSETGRKGNLRVPKIGELVYLCLTADSNKTTVTTSKGQYWECPCKLAGLTKTPFTMGYNPNTNGAYQSGLDAKVNIYETRLYNRALSKEEIAHNMNFAKTKYNF